MSNEYKAGQCNIGTQEQQKRLMSGIFGLILVTGLSYIFYIFPSNSIFVFIVLSIAGFITSLGLIQKQQKFCVYYGMTNQYNVSDKMITPKTIIDLAESKQNKEKSAGLLIISILLGMAYAGIYVIFYTYI